MHRLRRPLAPTIVSVLIAFAVTMSIFATTGIAVASQQRALDVIDSPSGRLITISDPQGGAGLSPASIESIARLSGVDWVLGVGVARSVVNVHLPFGEPVQSRLVFGDLPPAITLDRDRDLLPGDAIAGQGVVEALGLADGVGAVQGRGVEGVVVASFVAVAPLEMLGDQLLVVSDAATSTAQVTTVWVSVDDVAQLPGLLRAVRAALVADDPAAVHVETVEELALLSQDLSGSLVESARWTLLSLLGAAAVLIATVQFGRVSGLARDIGRVRALGGTRTTVVVQMLVNAGACAVLGALGGTAGGLALTWAIARAVPSAPFVLGIPVLVVIAALLGALLPSIRASRLDPVSILRVP